MTRSKLLLATMLTTLSLGAVAQGTGSEAAGGNGTGMDTGTGTTGTTEGTTEGTIGRDTDRGSPSFEDLDTNGDGSIDENEAREGNFSTEFRAIDRDGRNAIDRDQFDQYRGQSGQGR